MKRFIIILLGMTIAFNANCQAKEVYALVGVFAKSSNKMLATIDFGDGTKERYIADEKGEKKIFVSTFEPINFLMQKGWKIDSFNPFTTSTGAGLLVVMKKEISEESQKTEGLLLTDK